MTGDRPDDDLLDPRLEHELRDALQRRDPGPAPLGLRERVLDTPDHPRGARLDARRALSLALGLAATVALAVVALSTVGHLASTTPAGFPTGPAATGLAQASATSSIAPTPFVTEKPTQPGSQPASTPIPVATTQDGAGPAFDPNVEGPGTVARVDDGNGERILIGLAILLVLGLAASWRGRRRLAPAAVAVGLAGWVVAASVAPVSLGSNGWGPGLYTQAAPQPLGYDQNVLYELAPAGAHFTFPVLDVGGESLLPATLEAIEAPNLDRHFIGVSWTAAWLDREVHGGSSGPVEPLHGLDIAGGRTIWIVGRAGACAPGPSFDAQHASQETAGWESPGDSITVQVSVLGIPRRVTLPLRARVVEPSVGGCAGPIPAPLASGTPSTPSTP